MEIKPEEKSEERAKEKPQEKPEEKNKEETKENRIEKPEKNLEKNVEEKTEEKAEEKTEEIPKIPMLPPNLNLSLHDMKPKRYDPTMDKLIEKAKNFQGDLTLEVSKKYQLTEEKNPDCLQEADATGIKPEENLENKTKCFKCEKMVLYDEIQSHINAHTSQVINIYMKRN